MIIHGLRDTTLELVNEPSHGTSRLTFSERGVRPVTFRLKNSSRAYIASMLMDAPVIRIVELESALDSNMNNADKLDYIHTLLQAAKVVAQSPEEAEIRAELSKAQHEVKRIEERLTRFLRQ